MCISVIVSVKHVSQCSWCYTDVCIKIITGDNRSTEISCFKSFLNQMYYVSNKANSQQYKYHLDGQVLHFGYFLFKTLHDYII